MMYFKISRKQSLKVPNTEKWKMFEGMELLYSDVIISCYMHVSNCNYATKMYEHCLVSVSQCVRDRLKRNSNLWIHWLSLSIWGLGWHGGGTTSCFLSVLSVIEGRLWLCRKVNSLIIRAVWDKMGCLGVTNVLVGVVAGKRGAFGCHFRGCCIRMGRSVLWLKVLSCFYSCEWMIQRRRDRR